MHSLRKVQEAEFLMLVIDTAKPTIHNKYLKIQKKNRNILYI